MITRHDDYTFSLSREEIVRQRYQERVSLVVSRIELNLSIVRFGANAIQDISADNRQIATRNGIAGVVAPAIVPERI